MEKNILENVRIVEDEEIPAMAYCAGSTKVIIQQPVHIRIKNAILNMFGTKKGNVKTK